MPAPLLKIATSILDELRATRTITAVYSHENTIVNTEHRFNCYGFLLHLIHTYCKEAFQDLLVHMENLTHRGVPTSLDLNKPSPFNFFHIFKNLHNGSLESDYWLGVEDIMTILPGDVLVYLEPGFVSPERWNKERCRVTHIMLVSKIIDKSPFYMKVEIIDSTHQPHSEEDTRNNFQPEGGLGKALLTIRETETEGTYILNWGSGGDTHLRKELFAGRVFQ